jgi:hypothetical protein
VWEKIADKVKAIGASTKGLKKKVATFAKGRGLLYETRCQMGGTSVTARLLEFTARLLTFWKLV